MWYSIPKQNPYLTLQRQTDTATLKSTLYSWWLGRPLFVKLWTAVFSKTAFTSIWRVVTPSSPLHGAITSRITRDSLHLHLEIGHPSISLSTITSRLTWDSLHLHLDVGHPLQLAGYGHFQTADARGSTLSLCLPLLSVYALPHLKWSALPESWTGCMEKTTTNDPLLSIDVMCLWT